MTTNTQQRPRFYEGQYLGADDLTDAIEYGRQVDARHALGAHTFGIAVGFELVERPGAGGQIEISVLPGYAWDGFGRPIVLLAPQRLPAESFAPIRHLASDEPNGRLVTVWASYDESVTRDSAPGFEVCDTADQRRRIEESVRFFVGEFPTALSRHATITVNGQPVDAEAPLLSFDPAAPHFVDESVPFQNLPATSPGAFWRVPIGRVRWKPGSTPATAGEFKPRNDGDKAESRRARRYIGVVAESVNAAGDRLRLRRRDDDPTAGPFEMPADDLVWVEGNLDVEGTTKLIGGRLELRDTNGDDYKKPLALQAAFDPLGGRHALQAVVGTVTDNPPNRLAIGPQASDTDPSVTERVVVLGTGEVGIGTSAPTQMLTLESPEGTRLEITRTSASLPWSSSAPATPGSFVINHQAAGSTTPEADFALMRDRKKRLILGDDSTYLTSQNNGAVIFLTNFEETGQRENVRITPAGRVGIGTTTPFAALDVRGDILLGPNDDLFAASGEENLRIIRGVVAANLLTLAGDGFVPYPLAPTGYHIYFAVPFVDQPAATVSVISNDLSMRAVIQSLTTGALDLVIVNDGGPVISDFSFIVMGKR